MQIGKYQLIHKLATGGMAEVFLAKAAGPMGFEKLLVLKRILPHLASEPTFVEMFLAEARLAAQLNHPNIVQIFDFGEADGTYFIAMEYIDGPNLREIIRRASSVSLSLPIAFCARVVCSACEGLAFAHDFKDPATHLPMNIVHRDISPDNLLLSRQGAVKVVDFGIAKAAGQSPHTQTGILKGKLAYMSPEQLRNESLDRRADVYALGVVLYELLTGLKPFIATSEAGMVQAILFEMQVPVIQRRPDVPESLQRILAKALAKERERRYLDCASFHADLEEFILSTGKPMGASQMALLVSMMIAGAEGPFPFTQKTNSSPRSNPKFSQSQPQLDLSPGAPLKPSPEQAPAPVVEPRLPESREFKEERTSAERPSRLILREIQRASQPSEPPVPPPAQALPPKASRHYERDTVWVARIGILLVLAGGGYLSQRIALGPPIRGPPPELPASVPASTPSPQLPTPTPPDERLPGGVQPPPQTPSNTPASQVLPPSSEDAGTPAAPVDAGSVSPSGKRLSPRPPAGQGELELRVEPEGLMFLDGWQYGMTRVKFLQVDAGKHTVKVIHPVTKKEKIQEVKVTAGRKTRVTINLLED